MKIFEVRDLEAGVRLSKALREGGTIVAPGVFNPISAMLAKKHGFKAIYLSGAALTASYGLPDLGLITLDEIVYMVRRIYSVVDLPLIVDADVGFGGVLNVARTVKELEEAGAAAVQIEDQEMPKKCGHLSSKRLIPVEEMVHKIQAARKVRKNMLIIARTDARAVEGLKKAVERAQKYAEAGADIIFPEALINREEFELFRKEIHIPLLANMTEFGQTPYTTVKEFAEMGYNIVIFPVTALRMALPVIEETYRELSKKGTQRDLLPQMMTREELYRLINYYDYEEFDRELSGKDDNWIK